MNLRMLYDLFVSIGYVYDISDVRLAEDAIENNVKIDFNIPHENVHAFERKICNLCGNYRGIEVESTTHSIDTRTTDSASITLSKEQVLKLFDTRIYDKHPSDSFDTLLGFSRLLANQLFIKAIYWQPDNQTTTVKWEDNSVTTVKRQSSDINDLEAAVNAAIAKKLYPNHTAYKRKIGTLLHVQYSKKKKKEEK